MFNPSRDEARRFLAEAWRKYRGGQPLSGLEQTAAGIVAMHPEYHARLVAAGVEHGQPVLSRNSHRSARQQVAHFGLRATQV